MSYKEFKSETDKRIIEAVSEIIVEDWLNIKNRRRSVAYRRFYLMDILRKNTVLTYAEIASLFGGAVTNHTSVIHGIKQRNIFMERNDSVFIRSNKGIESYLRENFSDLKF